jgi:hypothetical protein
LNLSDNEWKDVIAKLRKRVRVVMRSKYFCGCSTDDVIGDALVRYFQKEDERDRRIYELFPVEQRLLGLTRLLSFICHGVVVDRLRRAANGSALEQPYPEGTAQPPALLVSPGDYYDYNVLKRDLLDGADDADRAFVESFSRLAEGPLLTPNQQVAEDLDVPIEAVLSFKRRFRSAKGPW